MVAPDLPPSTVQLMSQLITVKLGDSNYLIWKQQVLAAIRGYGLESFINGAQKQPIRFTPEGSNTQGNFDAEYITWERQDQMISSSLLSSLSESMLINVVGCNTAYEIWPTIGVGFSSQSRAKILQIKEQLQFIKKGKLSMRDYLNKVKSLCDALSSAGHRVTEEDQILYVLAGLGSEYNTVIVSVSARIDPMTLMELNSLLLTFESRLERVEGLHTGMDHSYPSVNMEMQGSRQIGGYSYRGRGNRGGRTGGRGRTYGGMKCQICHRTNHTADRCFYRTNLDYVPNMNPNNNNNNSSSPNQNYNNGGNYNNQQHQHKFQHNANFSQHNQGQSENATLADFTPENSWYPDSGANSHVTYDFNNLSVSSEYPGQDKVYLGNGSGSTHRSSSSSDGLYNFRLQCQPSPFPLLPASQPKWIHIATTRLDLDICHCRLGHSPMDVVKRALDSNKISFIPVSDSISCDGCLKSKSHKLPFPISITEHHNPLEHHENLQLELQRGRRRRARAEEDKDVHAKRKDRRHDLRLV